LDDSIEQLQKYILSVNAKEFDIVMSRGLFSRILRSFSFDEYDNGLIFTAVFYKGKYWIIKNKI
jgi:hypothetical protein